MHVPWGAEFTALAGVLAAVPAVLMLLSSARRRTGPSRRAHRLLAAGGAAATVVVGLSLVAAALLRSHQVHADHANPIGTATAVAMVVATVALLGGTLTLPGAAQTPAAAVCRLLDGLVIAGAVWFVGWVLVADPTKIMGRYTPYACLPLLLPAAVAVVTLGLTVILASAAPRPRAATVRVGCGVTLVALGGTGLAGGICQGWTGVVLGGAVALPAGLSIVAFAVRSTDRAVTVDGEPARGGSAYAFLPMVAVTVSASYHLARGGDFGWMAVAAISVEGFALVGRQHLALLDVRRFADRLVRREAHFRELAHTDPLTGLANRRGLLRTLENEAFAGQPCVLLGLDLDGFKNINDMRGHDVGDAVLIEVGQRLRMNLRPGDAAARLGGDEFAVLMWVRPEEAHGVAQRLLGVLARPYEQDQGPVFLSASIGLAASGTAADVPGLMRNADLALRFAKQRGKNRVERYDARYDGLLRRRTVLEHELRGAVQRDELRLVYQPVVALPSARPAGAEALLRWHHPRLGLVSPGEFIPVAEECGMIDRLGEWVLHQACRQLSHWLAAGHDVWVSVNVSPRELHEPGYADRVAEALRQHRVPPQRLVLEVTEHAVATDLEELVRRLRTLRATGVRIALDDFGAGYSSLGQLRDLPIDILKIDQKLVAEPESRTGTTAPMVDVVVRLGHRLGLEVIAEGIGTPAQLKVVDEAGCRFGQGSLFGWGVPAEHLGAQLANATAQGGRVATLAGQRGVAATVGPAVAGPAGPVPVSMTAATAAALRAATERREAGGRPSGAWPVTVPASRSARNERGGRDATPAAQDMGAVDSGREMRQA